MKLYKCTKDCHEFPITTKGKCYYGTLDSKGYLWLLDDFWLDMGVKVETFDLKIHGDYVEVSNLTFFEEVK